MWIEEIDDYLFTKFDTQQHVEENPNADYWDEKRRMELAEAEAADMEELEAAAQIWEDEQTRIAENRCWICKHDHAEPQSYCESCGSKWYSVMDAICDAYSKNGS